MRVTGGYAISIKNYIAYYATSALTKPFIVNEFQVKLILDPTGKYNFVVQLEKLSSLQL